jgi:hypothetical protein
MALQPKIIACGKSVAMFSMVVRFLVGPAVMAAISLALGIRGVLLHVAVVQVNFISNNLRGPDSRLLIKIKIEIGYLVI